MADTLWQYRAIPDWQDQNLTLVRGQVFQLFKYAVYALLTANIFFFFFEELAATEHRFVQGLALADMIEAYAATIDTTAWVVLLLMFELETYVLEERHVTRSVRLTLHSIRVICYAFIIYAFTGYLDKLVFLLASAPMSGISDLCSLVDGQWTYAIDLDEYEVLTTGNCMSFSSATEWMRLPGLMAVVDQPGLVDIVRLAWVDVINSGVWLLVVFGLEVDVRLKERNLLHGRFLQISTVFKSFLYAILFLAAVYWGMKGDFVDFWDAFLWLVAFVFIERNVFEWRREVLAVENLA